MKIYDISPTLHSGLEVWPGDVPFSREIALDLASGDNISLSSIRMSLHAGSHLDAPSHFMKDGASMAELSLPPCIGPARLVSPGGAQKITIEDLRPLLGKGTERVLFRLHPGRDPDRFPRDFRYFSTDAAKFLVESGVVLVGTDAPSVDAFESRSLPAHRIFGRGEVYLLENLEFGSIPDGEYELIALPLKVKGGDAGPVRAVLRSLESH